MRHRFPVSTTSLQVLLMSLHSVCDCRLFRREIIFGSKAPSCSLHHRQFNFYALRRTFSFSAGVTNGIQKAFNGLPPALNAAPCSPELYSTWLELPLRCRLQVRLGFTFVWHLSTQGLRFDNFTKQWIRVISEVAHLAVFALQELPQQAVGKLEVRALTSHIRGEWSVQPEGTDNRAAYLMLKTAL